MDPGSGPLAGKEAEVLSSLLYEGMFLFDSNLAVKDWPGLESHVNEILSRNKAELLYSEKWPDRRLAYDVRGCKKGTYYLTYFNAEPRMVSEIERDANLSERILRHLIIQERGLDREMERRKNREITAPPTDLSFEDDRFDSRDGGYGGFGGFGGRPRRFEAPAAADPVSPDEDSAEGGG